MNQGKVTKAVGGIFFVASNGKEFRNTARKKVRYNLDEIFIGDEVAFEIEKGNKGTIEEVLPRKNLLCRPMVANVDQAVILVSTLPQPDFGLVDKILINCVMEGISPILVVNKSDFVSKEFFESVKREYNDVLNEILFLNTIDEKNTRELLPFLKDKLSVLCGQSAVGKTSLLNCLGVRFEEEIGDLSQKSKRGKHTTRHSKIFEVEKNSYVVDTPGFSLLELKGLKSWELALYYPDFHKHSHECKYNMCTHISEPNCKVKSEVENGGLSKSRYQRYISLFNEVKELEKNQY